jgi:hypothetical protein
MTFQPAMELWSNDSSAPSCTSAALQGAVGAMTNSAACSLQDAKQVLQVPIDSIGAFAAGCLQVPAGAKPLAIVISH